MSQSTTEVGRRLKKLRSKRNKLRRKLAPYAAMFERLARYEAEIAHLEHGGIVYDEQGT